MNNTVDLKSPALYLNRELSLLAFFERVLAMAGREDIPLLERLRFLTICSTITDEFFEIRVAGVKERQKHGVFRPAFDGLGAVELIGEINTRVQAFVARQYALLNDSVLPALSEAGVRVLKRDQWAKGLKKWLRSYFREQVLPVLTPLSLDPAHPFPRILNKALNMFVALEGKDAFGRASSYAVLPVPRCLPRVILLPEDVAGGPDTFVLLSSVIHAHADEVFPGMRVTGCHQFRVTRNGDLFVDEEEVEDLLDALKGQLDGRRFSDAVRLEVARNCPAEHIEFLLEHFDLADADLYKVDGPVNLHRLVAVHDLVDRPELKFRPFAPAIRVGGGQDVFEVIARQDILLHHPFESFGPVVDLIRQGAEDPDVLAIKMTVYRTGSRSPVVEALLQAARAGKEVTAVIELRARFDEAANINLATRLQEAGAHVVYGVVGYKTHSKMLLIVRREGGRLRRYVHLGTGNYHSGTARAYTDFSYMTAREEVGADVHALFLQLTGLGRPEKLQVLLQSPFTLKDRLQELIDFEIGEARAGRKAHIMAKVNSLNEPTIMAALARASMAGVKVELVIRGVCCLRPGLPGVTHNIRIRSVLGRFLEHSRIYYFHGGGAEHLYLASADWMNRNLNRRVETCFPILDPLLKNQVILDGLQAYLNDSEGAWEMKADGSYVRVDPPKGEPRFSAQRDLLRRLS
ncbi:MAG: polyphosphate kinase 1 [Myxococcales bacterium]|nr:polyphosphate kinase 1 [Myxococcales bacterium]